MKERLFRTTAEWRRWLASNHTAEPGLWVVFTKASSRVQSIDYASALDEALCFGWIDSIIRRINDKRYARKFSPRRPNSVWSEINKKKVARLIRQKRMTVAGLQAIRQSHKSGAWHAKATPIVSYRMPGAFLTALKSNAKARRHFMDLASGQKKRFIAWIAMAKREETRTKRIRESVQLLEHNQKLGLK